MTTPSATRVASRYAGLWDHAKYLAPGQVWKLGAAIRVDGDKRKGIPKTFLTPNGRLYPYDIYIGDLPPIKLKVTKVRILEVDRDGDNLKGLKIRAGRKIYRFGSIKGRNWSYSVPRGDHLKYIFKGLLSGPQSPEAEAEELNIREETNRLKRAPVGSRVRFVKGMQHIYGGTSYQKMEDGPNGRWVMLHNHSQTVPSDWEKWLTPPREIVEREIESAESVYIL